MDLLASLYTNQCQHNYTSENQLPPETLGLNTFNHPWEYQVSYIFPPQALVPLVLSNFLQNISQVNSDLFRVPVRLNQGTISDPGSAAGSEG